MDPRIPESWSTNLLTSLFVQPPGLSDHLLFTTLIVVNYYTFVHLGSRSSKTQRIDVHNEVCMQL